MLALQKRITAAPRMFFFMIVGLKNYGLSNIDNYRLNTNLFDEMQ